MGKGYPCDYCCASGPDEFAATVQTAAEMYGEGKAFVYFGNNQDTAFGCREFAYAKVALGKLSSQVRIAGMNLQISRLSTPENKLDRNVYPIAGINLLVPLHPSHQPMVLDDATRESICDVSARDLRASFSGHMDPNAVRKKVFDLRGKSGTEGFHIHETSSFGEQMAGMTYHEMLRRSRTAFVPRGDEHYSFRLTEVVAAGAVPVLIDDDFVPPFGRPDMSEWAIRVPEADVPSSVAIINSLSDEQFCSFQRNATGIWRYSRDMDGLVSGLVEGLQRARVVDARRATGW
jgi:hypothetical protein